MKTKNINDIRPFKRTFLYNARAFITLTDQKLKIEKCFYGGFCINTTDM